MTRAEHMRWAKNRALQYVEIGSLQEAYPSIASDLQNHKETANHIGIQLGMIQMISGMLDTKAAMRDFINGFN